MENFIFAFKNIVVFFLINMLFPGFYTYSQTGLSRELTGFRGSEWGSSMDKVKAKVTESYLQSFHGFGIDALSYKGKIAGLTARIDYSFKDNKLIEGNYIIKPHDDFKTNFKILEKFLTNEYGNPNFKAGNSISSDSIWIRITKYGKFKGPELFWKFNDGFIGLIALKFEDDITITVLYSGGRSIEEYGSDRLIPADD